MTSRRGWAANRRVPSSAKSSPRTPGAKTKRPKAGSRAPRTAPPWPPCASSRDRLAARLEHRHLGLPKDCASPSAPSLRVDEGPAPSARARRHFRRGAALTLRDLDVGREERRRLRPVDAAVHRDEQAAARDAGRANARSSRWNCRDAYWPDCPGLAPAEIVEEAEGEHRGLATRERMVCNAQLVIPMAQHGVLGQGREHRARVRSSARRRRPDPLPLRPTATS